jgi:hypothetical protein
MQSDAKSAFYKKGHQNVRPGLHFGGLWGSLWITLDAKWHLRGVFLRGRIFGGKKVMQAMQAMQAVWAGGGVPINLNGWKALRP